MKLCTVQAMDTVQVFTVQAVQEILTDLRGGHTPRRAPEAVLRARPAPHLPSAVVLVIFCLGPAGVQIFLECFQIFF